MGASGNSDLEALREAWRAELDHLFAWWAHHLPAGDGFHGEIGNDGQPVAGAERGLVLNARLLWFFSAYHRFSGDTQSRALADRAAEYLRTAFVDHRHGGLVWSVDAAGNAVDRRKFVYGHGFALYGFAEHFRVTGAASSRVMAAELFALIEARFRDPQHGGYVIELRDDWRLQPHRAFWRPKPPAKDSNTLLHVLEAFSLWCEVAPSPAVAEALRQSIDLFRRHIVADGHLKLAFRRDWRDLGHGTSFGHDIEASWLLHRAAVALGDQVLADEVSDLALGLARTALAQGLGGDGEWWAAAEAMVGFCNAWQLSGDTAYLDAVRELWSFIKAQHVVPSSSGHEWTWFPQGSGKADHYLAGAWKCPYHNGRALMELLNRTDGAKPAKKPAIQV